MNFSDIKSLLAGEADSLLNHSCNTIDKSRLHIPSSTHVKDIFTDSDRPAQVLKNLNTLHGHGRLGGTGYLSILPVDQGIEHSAGASFAKNPDYFDPAHIVQLAMEGGCNAVASTVGVLGMVFKGNDR